MKCKQSYPGFSTQVTNSIFYDNNCYTKCAFLCVCVCLCACICINVFYSLTYLEKVYSSSFLVTIFVPFSYLSFIYSTILKVFLSTNTPVFSTNTIISNPWKSRNFDLISDSIIYMTCVCIYLKLDAESYDKHVFMSYTRHS